MHIDVEFLHGGQALPLSHVLRHSTATIIIRKGVALFAVARILGHSMSSVTERYGNFAPESVCNTVGRLDGGDCASGPAHSLGDVAVGDPSRRRYSAAASGLPHAS